MIKLGLVNLGKNMKDKDDIPGAAGEEEESKEAE
jgi:hypothetical protein